MGALVYDLNPSVGVERKGLIQLEGGTKYFVASPICGFGYRLMRNVVSLDIESDFKIAQA